MSRYVHRLVMPIVFPAGLHPGAGKDASNRLRVARDGCGRPVLRGTALAGALRHAVAGALGVRAADDAVSRWFGWPCDARGGDAHGEPSPLRVADMVLEAPELLVRHHIAVDRHRGGPTHGGLFDLEAWGPGTRGVLWLEVHDEHPEQGRDLLERIVGFFDAGWVLGGSGSRGVGRAEGAGPALWRRFDLRKLAEHAAILDERFFARGGRFPTSGEPLEGRAAAEVLTVRMTLAVPRGQDLLVGDGQALDSEMEPQRARLPDGQEVWRLPGSSLRGVLRGWVSRLARREGEPVADSLERFEAQGPAQGGDIGWGFETDSAARERIVAELEADPARLDERVPCPVMRLFGSLYSRGRIHVADSFGGAVDSGDQQRRAHVAVDRLTGGARDGFFFKNDVLCAGPTARFPVRLSVERPTEAEARWLASSLRAIDRGLVRIGSSKSGGRLALAESPTAAGPHRELFEAIQPSENSHG